MNKTFLLLGAALALLGVVLGALGAHVLHARLNPFLFSVFETALRYQFYHALGLMLVGVSAAQISARTWLRAAGWLMFAGVVLFSGSLYLLTVLDIAWIRFLTPIGGTAFIVAWALYIVSIVRSR